MICKRSKCHKQFVPRPQELSVINYPMIYLHQELLNTVDNKIRKVCEVPSSKKICYKLHKPFTHLGWHLYVPHFAFQHTWKWRTISLVLFDLGTAGLNNLYNAKRDRSSCKSQMTLQHEWALKILCWQSIQQQFMSG